MLKRTVSIAVIGLVIVGLVPRAQEKLRARDLFLSSTRDEKNIGSSSTKTVLSPLGLRYSILKKDASGEAVEVDPETVFRSGDRIRLSVESNDQGYLYIVMRGSSGKWDLLFPSKDPQSANANNVVEKGSRNEIPLGASDWFRFDNNPGSEKLFLVLSRKPEANFESLIQSLRGSDKPVPAQTATIKAPPKKETGGISVGPVDDATVGKIRGGVASRDLVFEKVNEERVGAKPDKAIYVVNKTASPESKIVLDLTLNHK